MGARDSTALNKTLSILDFLSFFILTSGQSLTGIEDPPEVKKKDRKSRERSFVARAVKEKTHSVPKAWG